ncbi:hypothetical protein B0H11DRAFT_1976146 [Mycena galericulata]|nr:hypothetical protein B0H11DRAFT_1976146 [Mycena galericulata]
MFARLRDYALRPLTTLLVGNFHLRHLLAPTAVGVLILVLVRCSDLCFRILHPHAALRYFSQVQNDAIQPLYRNFGSLGERDYLISGSLCRYPSL